MGTPVELVDIGELAAVIALTLAIIVVIALGFTAAHYRGRKGDDND